MQSPSTGSANPTSDHARSLLASILGEGAVDGSAVPLFADCKTLVVECKPKMLSCEPVSQCGLNHPGCSPLQCSPVGGDTALYV